MAIGIGIDTGGTYTDVVAYDYESGDVIAKNKTLTTKEDLTKCIVRSIDFLSDEILTSAVSICLSTTLATNACVEGRGGRGKLILLGLPRKMLDRLDLKPKYGIDPDDVLCIDVNGSFDGSVVDIPDWEAMLAGNRDFFDDAQSIAISEVNALRNNAAVEKSGAKFFGSRLDVPIVMASDLASKLNFIERGATALLNARLLPVISEFVEAVDAVLKRRGVEIPVMILRSDGSLMSKDLSRIKPVETILSGPAASAIGGKGISKAADCMIIDIGGTTTDISIVEGRVPAMTDSIKIGGWKTQVKGVFIDTYGLGGDSRVWISDGKLRLGTQRVVPLCTLASSVPQVLESLEMLNHVGKGTTRPFHEFIYILHEPESLDGFTDSEKRILEVLQDGPVMIGDPRFNPYLMRTKRLEDEGVIMRCGMTPTDVMHLMGDFDRFDKRASQLAMEFFAKTLRNAKTASEVQSAIPGICEEIYDLAKYRLFRCIMYSLIEYRYPEIFPDGVGDQMKTLIKRAWKRYKDRGDGDSSGRSMFEVVFDSEMQLVGIGAPTHVLLPDVAEAMGVQCIIPDNAEVANAIGTAIADISATVTVQIAPKWGAGGLLGYTVHASGGNRFFEEYGPAEEYAREAALADAEAEARARGALGELEMQVEVDTRTGTSVFGETFTLGIEVMGHAKGAALTRV